MNIYFSLEFKIKNYKVRFKFKMFIELMYDLIKMIVIEWLILR